MLPKNLLLRLEKTGAVDFVQANITLDELLQPILKGAYQKSDNTEAVEAKYIYEGSYWRKLNHSY